MSIQPFSKDVAVIQKLDDEPNDVTGLTPAELKLRFDQAAIWLKDYINNTLIPALSSNSSSGGTGASNIGAGVPDFSGSSVQAILNAFNDALVDRYTKAQTNSYVSQATNTLVSSVTVNTSTGVITVTRKNGTKQTFDTALEKVPASMELMETSGGTYLVITNQDGSKTQTDVSNLIDQYVFQDSTELNFSTETSGGAVTVTASIRPSSIGLDRFKAEVTEKLEEYNAASKANADEARQSASTSSTYSNFASEAALRAQNSLSQAQSSASSASGSATKAAQSASAAAASAQSAQSSAAQALESKNAAQDAREEAQRWAKEAENAAGGGVISFNGRAGSVVPQSGDYTAAQVGAIPSQDKGKAGGVASLDSTGKVPASQLPDMGSGSGPVLVPATVKFGTQSGEYVEIAGSDIIHLFFDGYAFYLLGDCAFHFLSTTCPTFFSITINAPGYEWAPSATSGNFISMLHFVYSSTATKTYPSLVSTTNFSVGAERIFSEFTTINADAITLCCGMLGEGRVIQ